MTFKQAYMYITHHNA